MEKSQIKIEKTVTELRIRGSGFDTSDEIYFCHVLPGDRFASNDGFSFDLKRLGQQGLSELLLYLSEHGYSAELDANANEAVGKMNRDKRELRDAFKTGTALKRKQPRTFDVHGFKRKLKPFQIPAVAHMAGVAHVANFSVPGSGKTTITLAAFTKLKQDRGLKTLVVVGPRSSFAPWENEFEECLGKTGQVIRITGNTHERARAWRFAEKADLVLLNYHVAANDGERFRDLLANTVSMLVLDESHYVKSITDSKWAASVRSLAPLAKKRVILSGTPAPNSIVDLWSQFNFLYPTETPLGPRDQFLFRVEHSGEGEAASETRKLVWPLFWRIRKRDLGLQKPRVTKIAVRMGEVQAAIYQALAFKVLKDYENAPEEAARMKQWRRARMIRLLQAASNPALLTEYSEEFKLPPLTASGLTVSQLIEKYPDFEVPAKITRAVSLIRKLTSNKKKVVVWTSFVHNIRMLLKLLKDASPLPIYGGIALSEKEDSEVNREKIIERFLSHPAFKILIANPAACAESISLHRACQDAIYLDRTFNCAHFMQSKDRIHRVGLPPDAGVNYFILQGTDTIDQVVDARLAVKQRRMLELLEADFSNVNLDSGEEVVSEDADEEVDFKETLKQIAANFRNDHEPK
jgi:SNF2 family DNA or RNA helicase